MTLIIVESPTKAKTIGHFLDGKYKVIASMGHVRDLPKSELGIDVDNNFKIKYVIPTRARKNVNVLKKTAAASSKVILATDEDREGESIAYHIGAILDIDTKELNRIVFHEITEKALADALKNPRSIDMNLVNAQQARRVLDRLVGYQLSPFLWKKIARGLSAGRVQSAALRIIVEREREVQKFKPQEYWELWAKFQKLKGDKTQFDAKLSKINDKTLKKLDLESQERVQMILADLKKSNAKIINVDSRETKRNPFPPFTTSTLQQNAWQRLKYSSKRTMMISQKLYEGIKLAEGPVGLITYMRTDSFNLSQESLASAKEFLTKTYGAKYALEEPRFFKNRSKLAQEAHEAIRPTNPNRTPEGIKSYLSPDEFKIYDLIWRRFVACQMPAAILGNTAAEIEALGKDNKYIFNANGQKTIFDGFLKIWTRPTTQTDLPSLEKEEELEISNLSPSNHFTQPPPRYNEASLIKIMEEYGIGRPSTYAPIISLIQLRNYVAKDENKSFYPTEMGFLVSDILTEHFPQIVDYKFTANMEKDLDLIAEGELNWIDTTKDFYLPFKKNLDQKYEEVSKEQVVPPETTDEICEKCGKPMVVKFGRFGKFLACSGFPECKTTKPLNNKDNNLNIPCPKCHEGEVIIRRSKKRGKIFYGCSKWPACDYISNFKPTGKFCPDCGEMLVEAKNSIKCSNKNCKYESPLKKDNPEDEAVLE